jgi:hypothetical protein
MPSVLLQLKSHHFHLADLNEINQRDVCNLNFIFTVGGNNNISVQMQHLVIQDNSFVWRLIMISLKNCAYGIAYPLLIFVAISNQFQYTQNHCTVLPKY